MKRALVFFLCWMLAILAKAYIFRNYQTENGLSHNSVWAVMQDRRGFIWLGTNDGLDRFDGKTFKEYRHIAGNAGSIGCNFIHTLMESRKGLFLIGTKQGLYRFDTSTGIFHHIDFGRRKDDDVVVNHIMEDANGDFWIACHGQGLYVLSPSLKVKKHYSYKGRAYDLPSNYIWTMAQDHNGTIWIGSDGEGLIKYDIRNGRFTKMADNKDLGLTDKTIYSLYCDFNDNVWVGTASNGLYRYNCHMGTAARYLNRGGGEHVENIKAIVEYSRDVLMVGAENGLYLVNRHDGTCHIIENGTPFGDVSNTSVFDIAKDREGAFWVATYFNGVNYFSPDINKFAYFGMSTASPQQRGIVSAFAEDPEGKVWIGTKDNGISLFNPRDNRLTGLAANVDYHDIQRLMMDGRNLWVSLYSKGVCVVDRYSHSIIRYVHNNTDPSSLTNDYVFAFARTYDGRVLLGTGAGGNVFHPAERSFRKIKALKDLSIKDILEDYQGNSWFATHGAGLIRIAANGHITRFQHDEGNPASLPGNNVNCIYQDARRRLWIGTEGNGLARFDAAKGNFDYILTKASGLPSDIIYDILDDAGGNIWVSTGGGLAEINPVKKTIRTFGYVESLLKIRYNLKSALRASDDRLYFGGSNGFVSFNPADITDNRNVPPVVITGFQIANKEMIPGMPGSPLSRSVSDTRTITLRYDQHNFSFDYRALSYLSSGENQYAYKLEGFDKDWNYVGNQTRAIYMNIPPGKYVFHVKASNNDGLWNETGQSIIIVIERPLWFSNWMIAFYLLLAISIGYYSFHNYERRVKRKNRRKIEKYQAMKEKETYESKINFFTNIAHEIRTPLSLIVAPLETVKGLARLYPQIMENLEIIDNNAHRLLNLVNQLLDFRKVEKEMSRLDLRMVNVIDIVKAVYNQYARNARMNGIELHLKTSVGELTCKVDREAVYKIVSNLLSNALKYANHDITLSVTEDGRNLLIAVTDDGCGISAEDQRKIFEPFYQIDNKANMVKAGTGLGLSLSKSLAAKHNGQLLVTSAPGKGSTFTLQLPIVVDDVVQTEGETVMPEAGKAAATEVATDGKHVLIVEDNVELRKFIVNNMKDVYTMFEAGNGIEALQALDKEDVDIIISDIIMPGMDGIELCRRVKSDPSYSYIPIILLSARTDTTSKIEGLERGADIYMEKPFSMVQLRAQVNSLIENRNNLRNRFMNSPLQYYKENKEKDNSNAEFIKKLNAIILEHITDENIPVEYLAGEFSMSRSCLHKKVKNLTGTSPNDYVRLIRLNRAAQLIASGKYKISEVCYLVGFNTPSYFSKCFFEQFGTLPKDYVQQIVKGNKKTQ